MPFWSLSRPMLATVFAVRGEGTAGRRARALGRKPTLFMPSPAHRSASSSVRTSQWSSSL